MKRNVKKVDAWVLSIEVASTMNFAFGDLSAVVPVGRSLGEGLLTKAEDWRDYWACRLRGAVYL